MYALDEVKKQDKEVYEAIVNETKRQQDGIELIASENFVSKAVMSAMGSTLTNKYAEGYPGKRYYGGCQCVDVAESLAIERAQKMFNTDYAVNVQPHCGANANLAVYMATCKPGDTVLGMSLDNGGHLTHGSPANFAGKWFNNIAYGVDENGYIDYDEVEKLAKEHKPKLIIAGFSAYPRTLDYKRFAEIAKAVDAYLMVDIAHIAGLIVAGVSSSPFGYADFVTTTTHKTLRGPRGGMILCKPEYEKQMNSAIFPGTQGGPLEHIIAAKAVCFGEALTPEFKTYQENVVKNANAMAKRFVENGIKLVSDGTDNHLMLLDLSDNNITGKELQHNLDEVHITLNKNTIPNDPNGPFVTTGVRIGTPACTTRGFGEKEFIEIADIITDVINDFDKAKETAPARVKALCDKFPLY